MQPWTVVVPAKRLAGAKTRLSPVSSDAQAHGALVLALLADTIEAALRSVAVGAVLVVTDEPAAVALAAQLGAATVPDEPDSGLNRALDHAALTARRRGAVAVATLNSDLAALRPSELTEALVAASSYDRTFAADHEGTGTTVLTAVGVPLDPRFGRGSAAAHAASGAVRLPGRWPGLALDVDTPADLRAAELLGVGLRTAAWLATSSSACRAR